MILGGFVRRKNQEIDFPAWIGAKTPIWFQTIRSRLRPETETQDCLAVAVLRGT
jgi:hypothetical protein